MGYLQVRSGFPLSCSDLICVFVYREFHKDNINKTLQKAHLKDLTRDLRDLSEIKRLRIAFEKETVTGEPVKTVENIHMVPEECTHSTCEEDTAKDPGGASKAAGRPFLRRNVSRISIQSRAGNIHAPLRASQSKSLSVGTRAGIIHRPGSPPIPCAGRRGCSA